MWQVWKVLFCSTTEEWQSRKVLHQRELFFAEVDPPMNQLKYFDVFLTFLLTAAVAAGKVAGMTYSWWLVLVPIISWVLAYTIVFGFLCYALADADRRLTAAQRNWN